MAEAAADSGDFFSNILKPGSSLHPKFLLALDITFTALFLILVALAFLTAGNIHLFALIAIELALWASVKWVVNELKNSPIPPEAEPTQGDSKADESKKNS
ncbi:hypothetical protein MSAN_01428700 [Mycena sanguinolenta]|uniref:Uncharacterized protein n=1 Tax=Mycena sanguinolenta TaxID=230812 RepID=A0A8H6YB27_9AGAR|nr:hypothetical protein MSAN_01428700 [Mycena sanguinolenta]